MKTKTSGNKKSIIKTIIIFICVLALSYILGYATGSFSANYEIDFDALKENIKPLLIYGTPILFTVFALFDIVFTFSKYAKAKKRIKNWDGENEEHIDKTESILDISTATLTVSLIFFMLLAGIWSYSSNCLMSRAQFIDMFPIVISTYGIFIVLMVYTILMLRANFQLIKKINPEKRGEILDLRFDKEYEKSLDENQKQKAYEAGFRAYKFMNYAMLAGWAISFISIYFGFGILPIIIVSFMWLTTTVVYLAHAYRLKYKRNKE